MRRRRDGQPQHPPPQINPPSSTRSTRSRATCAASMPASTLRITSSCSRATSSPRKASSSPPGAIASTSTKASSASLPASPPSRASHLPSFWPAANPLDPCPFAPEPQRAGHEHPPNPTTQPVASPILFPSCRCKSATGIRAACACIFATSACPLALANSRPSSRDNGAESP